jgi:hypothetical protein
MNMISGPLAKRAFAIHVVHIERVLHLQLKGTR